MIYVLWDLRSNNMLNTYDNLDEVRQLLSEAVKTHGESALECVMLLEDDPSAEDKTFIGVGSELLSFIRDAA